MNILQGLLVKIQAVPTLMIYVTKWKLILLEKLVWSNYGNINLWCFDYFYFLGFAINLWEGVMTHYEEYCTLWDMFGLQEKLIDTVSDPHYRADNFFFEVEVANIKDAMAWQKSQGFYLFPFYEV